MRAPSAPKGGAWCGDPPKYAPAFGAETGLLTRSFEFRALDAEGCLPCAFGLRRSLGAAVQVSAQGSLTDRQPGALCVGELRSSVADS